MLTQVINGSNGEVSGLDRLTENRISTGEVSGLDM
jgi:hypothetical protein